MQRKHYIMVQRDTSFWLIGPFNTYQESVDWAKYSWDSDNGDPRWQTIALSDWDAARPPTVYHPGGMTMNSIEELENARCSPDD